VKISPRLAGLAFLVSLNCVAISSDFAQSPTPTPTATPTATPPPLLPDGCPTAAITFPDSTSLTLRSHGGLFPLVATQTAQSLNIQLRFPLTLANTPLIVQVLDGGTLSNGQGNQIIGGDGTASIQFQVGAEPGLYRVLLNVGGAITTLRFGASGP
jgi:hypothetical protein